MSEPAVVHGVRVAAMTEIASDLRSSRWLWIAAIWCAGAVIDSSQTVLVMQGEGTHHSWLLIFGTELHPGCRG